jgi:hypothetical protein
MNSFISINFTSYNKWTNSLKDTSTKTHSRNNLRPGTVGHVYIPTQLLERLRSRRLNFNTSTGKERKKPGKCNPKVSQAWWYVPVIPVTPEA